MAFHLKDRAGGLLLHPTSLPGPHGIGDLGPQAYRFVDFLARAGLRWWQMLPVGPVGPGNSPYSSLSAFAGNPLLISLERLTRDRLLKSDEIRPPCDLHPQRVAYTAVARFKLARLHIAFKRFAECGGLNEREFVRFCANQAAWLDNYALYAALRRSSRDASWEKWPRDLRLRERAALSQAAGDLAREVDFERFLQYEFDRQWSALREYAGKAGVGLIGDIPIFVALDSSDVWAHRELFDLRLDGRPRTVSGTPPDIFSRTGQLWGHPQYAWARHKTTGFAWWIARFRRMFELFDSVRIDHFLGFHRVWAVPGQAKTALHGRWVKTPGAELFAALRRALGQSEIIAEDLGYVTPEALRLRTRCGFPGMRLLHFAFGNDAGDRYNQPHTYPFDCVVYPGTHDNDTTVGWFENLRREHRRRLRGTRMTPYQRALRYLGTTGREINWEIIRLALMSTANTAIIPVQDILGLDNSARMNLPATIRGNWEWRMLPGRLTPRHARRLRDLNEAYGRVSCHS